MHIATAFLLLLLHLGGLAANLPIAHADNNGQHEHDGRHDDRDVPALEDEFACEIGLIFAASGIIHGFSEAPEEAGG